MRLPPAILWVCVLIVLCVHTTETDTTAVIRRQDSEATVLPAISSAANEPSFSLSPGEQSGSQSADDSQSTSRPRITAESSGSTPDISSRSLSSQDAPTSSTSTSSITSALNGPLQTSSNPTSGPDKDQPDLLPLPPNITPALGVAGVFLILSGIIYTLIGIKNKWIQIFLSSAFLTSLSVTVLVIYVMSPLVTPAVQGAYLVAIFMTGVLFGAGSLFFKEVTEGLGCLLGGFCLSMWLLALQPGGTVHSTGGKVVFIAAFSVTTYALSFTRYTRPYGLIGATSFAGATGAVLGIDCFSRAGLKEFWLYIWNLNDNLFPLNTTTYPITRGIRVELALIVLICLLGVISQLKLWSIIKDRRKKEEAVRLGDERDRNQMEEEIGRRLEEGNDREMTQWEAVYGDGDDCKGIAQTDSGLGTEENNSIRKPSASVRGVGTDDSDAEALEITESGGAINQQMIHDVGKAGTTMTTVAENMADPLLVNKQRKFSSPESWSVPHHQVADYTATGMTLAQGSSAPSYPSFPRIIPLPFTIPSSEEPNTPLHGSVRNIPESDLEGHGPKNCSSGEGIRGDAISQPDAGTAMLCGMRSKSSSVAATVDDDGDELDLLDHRQKGRTLSESESLARIVDAPDVQSLQLQGDAEANQPTKSPPGNIPLSTEEHIDPEEFPRLVQTKSKPKMAQLASSSGYDIDDLDSSGRACRQRPIAPASSREEGQAQDSIARPNRRLSVSAMSGTGSLTKGALGKVPSQLSHIVTSYRTNEWAKHVSTADEPEFDAPELIPEGAEEELPTRLIENSTSLNVEIPQDNTTTVACFKPGLDRSRSKVQNLPPTDLNRTISSTSKGFDSDPPAVCTGWNNQTQQDTLQRLSPQLKKGNSSAAVLSRSTSATSPPLSLATRGLRSTSNPPFGQTLMTSPIDENAEVGFHSPGQPISPLPIADPTLLAKRDSLIRNKHYQFSTRGAASPTEMMYSQPPIRSTSRLSLIEEAGPPSSSRLGNLNESENILPQRSASRLSLPSSYEDDMPLSQRRAIIQQQQLSSDTRLGAAAQQPSTAGTSQKRDCMLASWKESMRHEAAVSTVPNETIESRRAEMMMEKRQSRMSQKYSETTRLYQENAFDQAMRRSDMQELHKEAIRKMQASANKHVSQASTTA